MQLTHEQIISLFQAESGEGRFNYAGTFVQSLHEYATEGRTAIRWKTKNEETPADKRPDVASVFVGYPRPNATTWPITDPGVPPIKIGNAQDCVDCHATGEVECHECRHISDCEKCGGRGYTGKKDESPERAAYVAGDWYGNADFIAMLYAIGVREIQVTEDNQPAYFAVGEYEGLIMPCSRTSSTMGGVTQPIMRVRKLLHKYQGCTEIAAAAQK
jgi:hypothetical protein